MTLAIMIFFFSSDTGEESGSKSSRVTRLFLSLFVEDFKNLSEEEQELLIGEYSFFVRKIAHFSEYAALSFFVYGSFYTSNSPLRNNRRIMIFIPWIMATLYAITDEIHQIFVAGRGPSVVDVMIDSLGAFFGAIAFCVITIILLKVHGRREK